MSTEFMKGEWNKIKESYIEEMTMHGKGSKQWQAKLSPYDYHTT